MPWCFILSQELSCHIIPDLSVPSPSSWCASPFAQAQREGGVQEGEGALKGADEGTASGKLGGSLGRAMTLGP